MTKELLDLIEQAKRVEMTPEDREAQRISFAFGNASLRNEDVTRETVRRASEGLRKSQHERPQGD